MFIVNGLNFSTLNAARDYADRLENHGREIDVEYRPDARPAHQESGDFANSPRRRHPALDPI
jgi:hypothetical protein